MGVNLTTVAEAYARDAASSVPGEVLSASVEVLVVNLVVSPETPTSIEEVPGGATVTRVVTPNATLPSGMAIVVSVVAAAAIVVSSVT